MCSTYIINYRVTVIKLRKGEDKLQNEHYRFPLHFGDNSFLLIEKNKLTESTYNEVKVSCNKRLLPTDTCQHLTTSKDCATAAEAV